MVNMSVLLRSLLCSCCSQRTSPVTASAAASTETAACSDEALHVIENDMVAAGYLTSGQDAINKRACLLISNLQTNGFLHSRIRSPTNHEFLAEICRYARTRYAGS